MPRLRHANGAEVDVPREKVEGLLRNGFIRAEEEKPQASATKKATTTKRASSSPRSTRK